MIYVINSLHNINLLMLQREQYVLLDCFKLIQTNLMVYLLATANVIVTGNGISLNGISTSLGIVGIRVINVFSPQTCYLNKGFENAFPSFVKVWEIFV